MSRPAGRLQLLPLVPSSNPAGPEGRDRRRRHGGEAPAGRGAPGEGAASGKSLRLETDTPRRARPRVGVHKTSFRFGGIYHHVAETGCKSSGWGLLLTPKKFIRLEVIQLPGEQAEPGAVLRGSLKKVKLIDQAAIGTDGCWGEGSR